MWIYLYLLLVLFPIFLKSYNQNFLEKFANYFKNIFKRFWKSMEVSKIYCWLFLEFIYQLYLYFYFFKNATNTKHHAKNLWIHLNIEKKKEKRKEKNTLLKKIKWRAKESIVIVTSLLVTFILKIKLHVFIYVANVHGS